MSLWAPCNPHTCFVHLGGGIFYGVPLISDNVVPVERIVFATTKKVHCRTGHHPVSCNDDMRSGRGTDENYRMRDYWEKLINQNKANQSKNNTKQINKQIIEHTYHINASSRIIALLFFAILLLS